MLIVKALAGLTSYALAMVCNAYAETPPSAASALSPLTQAENVASTTAPPTKPAYPLKASSNGRYLVDQNELPFLMVGDAPQTLIVNLSQVDAATYMANRAKYGINTLWINLLCEYSDGCNKDATTFDGIPPFTVAGDLSTQNPAYFRRADDMINIAAANGMVVLLDPIETSSWLDTLRANGTAKAFEYGQWLGDRYRKFPNIIWMHGNDFQTWKNAADDALVQAVARGIRSRDPSYIHTVELNYPTSGSLDDPTWRPLIELDAAYTYFPTYTQVLTEYNRSNFKPVFMVEATLTTTEFVIVKPSHGPGLVRPGLTGVGAGGAQRVGKAAHTQRGDALPVGLEHVADGAVRAPDVDVDVHRHRRALHLQRPRRGPEVAEGEGALGVVAQDVVVPATAVTVDVEGRVRREAGAQQVGILRGDGGEVVTDEARHPDVARGRR